MDKYFRSFPKIRGGSALFSDGTPGSLFLNAETFGSSSALSKFWLKVSGIWKECVTWLKVSGIWKVASPKIKVSGTWTA